MIKNLALAAGVFELINFIALITEATGEGLELKVTQMHQEPMMAKI